MRNYIVKFCLYLFPLLFVNISCNTNDKEDKTNADFASKIAATYNDDLSFNEWFEPLRTIHLQPTNPLISEIEKVLLYENKIFILDDFSDRTIFVFDTSGTWLGKISREGKDAFDSDRIEDFAVGNGQVVVVTDDRYLFFYDVNNFELKKKVEFSIFFDAIAHHPNGGWFLSTNQIEDNTALSHLFHIDDDGKIQNSLYPITKGELNLYGGNLVNKGDGLFLLYSATHDNAIYKVFINSLETFFSLENIPINDLKGISGIKDFKMMNDVIIHAQDKLIFSTTPVFLENIESQQVVYTNIFDTKKNELFIYKYFSSDYLFHAMSRTPISVVQDSLLLWPLYADGVDAFRLDVVEKNLPLEAFAKDTIAKKVLLHTKPLDNPVLLLGRFKK